MFSKKKGHANGSEVSSSEDEDDYLNIDDGDDVMVRRGDLLELESQADT